MNDYGSYVGGCSVVHGMDPRSKIIAAAAMSVIVFRAGILTLALTTLMAATIVLTSRLPARRLWRGLRPALPFVLVVFLLHALFSVGPTIPSFSLGPLHVGADGAAQGGILAWRLVLLLVAGLLLSMTTAPSELTRGIESLLRPVRALGLSSQDLALTLSLALRFIPTVLAEAAVQRDAQSARGACLDAGSPAARLRAMSNLAVPLCLAVFRRCDDLVTAMEARGYDGGVRTGLREPSLSMGDRLVIGASVVGAAAVFVLPVLLSL